MMYLTSLMAKPLSGFGELDFAYHYTKGASTTMPYAVWQERGESDFHSDNEKSERALEGVIDFFTLNECDTRADSIEEALVHMKAAWSLSSVQFEDDTNLIHLHWEWSVM